MPAKIGITFNPTQDLFYSGSNQTSLLLAELLKRLHYDITLVNTKSEGANWWTDFPQIDGVSVKGLYDLSGMDVLIDVDGHMHPDSRKNIAKMSIVFLRYFLQFTEMDNSLYPETPYLPRSFEGISEIWCWDILNPPETLDSVQTIFNCPIKRVPFVWSPNIVGHYIRNLCEPTYDNTKEWTVRIAEKLNDTSSPVLPLVAVRELVLKKDINATYKCHNANKIRENKFFVDNVLNNIEISKLPVEFVEKEAFYKWSDTPNNIFFTHSRFVPIRIGLINAVWCGLPLIHNSPCIGGLHPVLSSMSYFGNEVTGVKKAFKNFTDNPGEFYNARNKIRESIMGEWGIDSHILEWNGICQRAFKGLGGALSPLLPSAVALNPQPAVSNNKEVVIAFSDMWTGFNYDKNFIIDSMRHEYPSVKIKGVLYDETALTALTAFTAFTASKPNLLIFGPYTTNWKSVPPSIPKVLFSAENWAQPDDDTDIALFMTSSRTEDAKHFRIPTWMTFIDWYSDATTLPEGCEDNPIRIPLHFAMNPHPVRWADRKEFCGFVVSNPLSQFRNDTFKAVDTYKRVNSGGALFNNIGSQLSLKYPGGGGGDISKHHFFSQHKFTISFENSQSPGYITEKVLHAKMAGAVPIYWGDSETDCDFVENSFINVSNMNNPEMIVEVIKKLESNSAVCDKIASTPILNEQKKRAALNRISNMCKRLMALSEMSEMSEMSERRIDNDSNNTNTNTNTNNTKNLVGGFDKTFVVNLDSRSDRWNALLQSDEFIKNNATHVSAVNGKTLEMTPFIYNLFEHNDYRWKKSLMGCGLTHIRIWSELLSEGDSVNSYLILEDDVRFEKDWRSRWEKMSKEIPADAELIYLGGVLPPNKAVLPLCIEQVNDSWAKIIPNKFFSRGTNHPIFHFCTYSYILTKAGARKLIDFLTYSKQKFFTGIDHFLHSYIVGLRAYVAYPLLTHCFQDEDETYCKSDFNNLDRVDSFDSDIWNNKETFTEADLAPFRGGLSRVSSEVDLYYIDTGKLYELYEKQWVDEIFSTDTNLKSLSNFDTILPDGAWFIVQRPHLDNFRKYFEMLNSKGIGFKVLHLSDEFGVDDVSFYSLPCCKAVIRNYVHGKVPVLPHIITVPLGYHYKGASNNLFSDRTLVWSFHGTEWFDRRRQLEYLSSIVPHNCHFVPDWNHPTMTNQSKYLSTLENSKFCPILRGNNVETFRMYETLETGAIPLYVRTTGDDAFFNRISQKLGIDNLETWAVATDKIQFYLSNPDVAEKYRRGIYEKWMAWKCELQQQIKMLR